MSLYEKLNYMHSKISPHTLCTCLKMLCALGQSFSEKNIVTYWVATEIMGLGGILLLIT